MKRVKFLNTEVDNVTLEEALHEIEALVEKRTPSYVVTPNSNI
jgi:UDP-N-acetyl-D-mannosaminuronic acid transferase (WecB/TagA/CpsF family)